VRDELRELGASEPHLVHFQFSIFDF
jgi:hypothetical protein